MLEKYLQKNYGFQYLWVLIFEAIIILPLKKTYIFMRRSVEDMANVSEKEIVKEFEIVPLFGERELNKEKKPQD
jgi:hypothetical protein